MEEDTPSEACSQQSSCTDAEANVSSQYLEPVFYVKIAPVDDEEERNPEATDQDGLKTNNSVCGMDTSPSERVDDKASMGDSMNWGETPIAHTSDYPVSNFSGTAFKDVAIGEPLLIQPEQNFSSNLVTDIGLQEDELVEVKMEKVKIEPEEEPEYDSEEFDGEFSGTFPMENCHIKTEPNSDVIGSFDQWESAQKVLNGAVTYPVDAIQTGANEKKKKSHTKETRNEFKSLQGE